MASALRRIVIAGGSGFLGQSLIDELRTRCGEIIVLTRGAERTDGKVRYVHWEARTAGGRLADADQLALLNRRLMSTMLLSERVQLRFPQLDPVLADLFCSPRGRTNRHI